MKEDNKTVYVILVLVGCLIGFGAFVFFNEPNTYVEDNYVYSNGEQMFNVTKVDANESYVQLYVGDGETPYLIALRNDPVSLEDIQVEGVLNTRIYNDEQIWLTINPNANLSSKTTVAVLEVDKIIDNDNLYGIPANAAMTMENDYNYPVKSCYDGTDKSTVIFFTLGSETKVYTDEYCIIIVGTTEDEIIRAADRFVLTLLGVMQA
ncbi:hypothetical protein J4467_00140 [Candidatus Woesearchaeota archaeon]|nr:hypothetical protein [Candidatus Woesearchaeota archaeon]